GRGRHRGSCRRRAGRLDLPLRRGLDRRGETRDGRGGHSRAPDGGRGMSRFDEVLGRLSAVIGSRKGGDAATSYTARLLADPSLAAKKLGEEAIETVIAAIQGERSALAAESADLVYH